MVGEEGAEVFEEMAVAGGYSAGGEDQVFVFILVASVEGVGCRCGREFLFVGCEIGDSGVHRNDEGYRIWSGLGLVFRVFFAVVGGGGGGGGGFGQLDGWREWCGFGFRCGEFHFG